MIKHHSLKLLVLSNLLFSSLVINPVFSQTEAIAPQFYQILVNSNLDGNITPDEHLTFREAIAIVNNTLPFTELSPWEQTQVKLLENAQQSKIEFNLNIPENTIKLTSILSPIANPVTIDGTTNPGYDINKFAFAEKDIPIPVVAITPAENTQIFRGLTLVSDNITIRGLSIYGFKINTETLLSTNPGDIVIAHKLKPEELSQNLAKLKQENGENINVNYLDLLGKTYLTHQDKPTHNIIIENNFLGISPDQSIPEIKSNFGINILNSVNPLINNNYISYHEGSGILTQVRAENAKITNNVITNNGIKGVPDAIRLEGNVTDLQIDSNLICGNDGSSIYFKRPEGNVNITNNTLKFNGQRIRSASVFLTGNNHQVSNNKITDQIGPGVVVAAYPQSQQNLITNNEFNNLEGLSIDLNSKNQVGLYESRIGNGINPSRNSKNRRQETGNAAINSPQFLSNEFFVINNKVAIDGIAEPGSLVTIYQVTESGNNYGPLNKPLMDVLADEKGHFSANLNLKLGDTISAIASIPKYGTSEPAQNANIIDYDRTVKPPIKVVPEQPRCTSQLRK